MKTSLFGCLALLITGFGCYAQVSQPPATADELQYLRFMLMSVGSIDHHPAAVKSFEDHLVMHFGFNSQESALVHAAGQEMNALLQQLRQSSNVIVVGRRNLSPGDSAALSNLAAQREQRIEMLANRILNAVRPETAARLKVPGRVAATKVKKP